MIFRSKSWQKNQFQQKQGLVYASTEHWPTTEAEFLEKMIEMESMWQFPCCFGAVDGCQIPIRCSSGGKGANKEYHNFKNFYSVVLIGLVDAKYRFIWASCGFPETAMTQ